MIPLSMASPGTPLRVVAVNAGGGLTRRLADMGLIPGVSIRLISNLGQGPVLIDLRGSKIALGFGITQKIIVTEG